MNLPNQPSDREKFRREIELAGARRFSQFAFGALLRGAGTRKERLKQLLVKVLNSNPAKPCLSP